MFLSSTVFAEYPGKKEEEKFTKYFFKICKSIKGWNNADKYANKFDNDNNINELPFTQAMELRRNYLETHKKGNDKFASAALALKLDKLGFENYQTIIVLSNGYDSCIDFSNLYRTRTNDWLIADFFIGVECIKDLELKYSRNPFKETVIKKHKLNEYLCLQSSKIPLQTYVDDLSDKLKSFTIIHKSNDEKLAGEIDFLDIKDFLCAYELSGSKINLCLPEKLEAVYHEDVDRIFNEKWAQLKEMNSKDKP